MTELIGRPFAFPWSALFTYHQLATIKNGHFLPVSAFLSPETLSFASWICIYSHALCELNIRSEVCEIIYVCIFNILVLYNF